MSVDVSISASFVWMCSSMIRIRLSCRCAVTPPQLSMASTACDAPRQLHTWIHLQESLRSGANATSLSNDPATDAVQPPGKQQNHVQAKAAGRRRDVDMADCPGSAGQGGMILLLRIAYVCYGV